MCGSMTQRHGSNDLPDGKAKQRQYGAENPKTVFLSNGLTRAVWPAAGGAEYKVQAGGYAYYTAAILQPFKDWQKQYGSLQHGEMLHKPAGGMGKRIKEKMGGHAE